MMDIRFVHILHASFVLLAYMSEVFAVNMQVGNASIKCTERDRQALLALKQGFVDHSTQLSSWGNGENQKECCKWEGIQCNDKTGQVVKLDLRGDLYSLEGTITPSLAELHHLNYLDLSLNNFKNLIHFPKFVASLIHLNYLNLSYNLFEGKIPYELGDLFQMQYLDLQGNSFDGEFPTQVCNMSRLVHLNLADNWLSGQIPDQIGNLSFLQFLDLSGNFITGTIPHSLEKLSSLQLLDLSDNYFEDKSLQSDLEWVSHLTSLNSLNLATVDLTDARNWMQQVSNLSHLQDLLFISCNLIDKESWSSMSINSTSSSLVKVDLSHNNLTPLVFPWLLSYKDSLSILLLEGNHLSGPIPEALGNFSSLLQINFAYNRLEGGIPKSLLDLCNLQLLVLSGNNLSGRLEEFVPTFSHCDKKSLQELRLSYNHIVGSVPDLSQFSSLTRLYLDSNKLNGTLSNSIGQLSNLNYLTVHQNFLQSVVSEAHFLRLSKLQHLDLSFNALVFNVSNDWIPPFQLDVIKLASCKLGPSFPIWLQTQKKYNVLDISSAEISDTIPDWFWELPPQLERLNLSHNHIRGKIPNLPLEYTTFALMDMSSNKFEGSIPSFLSMTGRLDVSKNKFSKAHSLLCANTTKYLSFLDLSNNIVTEELPECWMNFKSLVFLDLKNNNFYGNIPSSMGALIKIQALHLGNNNLMGELPLSMSNCTGLKVFEAVGNNLFGSIPRYIGDTLQNLEVLSLRSNHFNGSLPSSICHLVGLQILDLSLNKISGSIPKCLNNLSALATQVDSNVTVTYYYDETLSLSVKTLNSYDDSASLVWKGKESNYKSTLGLLRSIDLSSNMLSGEIPSEIMDLIGLISLNISRNKINGEIPPAIGRLKSLDFLDLSRNYLSGRIPSELSRIDRLSVLDLSYNNLSGEIPLGTQLQSFSVSSYLGNAELCGAPLSTCTSKPTEDNQSDRTTEDNEQFFSQGFYISLTIGFSTGFWGSCGLLYFKKSWRYAYFKILNDAYDKVYVVAAINIAKLRRRNKAST